MMKPNEQKMRWTLSPGEETSVIVTTPEQATSQMVLLIHGFMSNKNSETNSALTPTLLERGIATLRFDLFGHGESDGSFQRLTLSACLKQVDAAISWMKKNGYQKIGLVGSSFGGLIAIHAAPKYTDLSSLALRCPVSNYPTIWQARLGSCGIKRWKEDGQVSFLTEEGKATLEYGYYEDLLRYDTYSAAARICTPTLIVHGDADEDVPVDQSLRLYDTLRLSNTHKRLVVVPGADHGFSKEADFNAMTGEVMEWLTSSLGSSGAT